jgi:hypothetical protein
VNDPASFYDAIYKQQNTMLSKKAAAKEAAKTGKPVVTRVTGKHDGSHACLFEMWNQAHLLICHGKHR